MLGLTDEQCRRKTQRWRPLIDILDVKLRSDSFWLLVQTLNMLNGTAKHIPAFDTIRSRHAVNNKALHTVCGGIYLPTQKYTLIRSILEYIIVYGSIKRGS